LKGCAVVIIGTGIDIVEIHRIRKLFNRQPRFAEKILTDNELQKFDTLSKHRKIEFLAGRFAVKEALAKAKGTGIGAAISWHGVEVLSTENGKPTIRSAENETYHISISHSREYAIANVIIESSSR
jgi:holo-[acyl-carrier protein] synthase